MKNLLQAKLTGNNVLVAVLLDVVLLLRRLAGVSLLISELVRLAFQPLKHRRGSPFLIYDEVIVIIAPCATNTPELASQAKNERKKKQKTPEAQMSVEHGLLRFSE